MNDDTAADDALLDALGARLREREATWERVAERDLDPARAAQLRAQAGDDDQQLALARALYLPVAGPELDEAESLRRDQRPAAAQPTPANSSNYAWWLVAAAVLAALVIASRLLPNEAEPQAPLLAQALPSYTFDPGQAPALERGDSSGPAVGERLVYHPNNAIRWTLRPETEAEVELATRVFRRDEHGLTHLELGDALTLHPCGVATLDLRARELGLGELTLLWTIGPPQAYADAAGASSITTDTRIHVQQIELRVDPS